MEKTISVEEKIRRAEEIYSRRNGSNYTYSHLENQRKKGPSLITRMLKQIVICFIIYGIFYVVTNRQYYMSKEFQTKVEQYASQNEVTKNAYYKITDYLKKYIPWIDNENSQTQESENKQETNQEQINQEQTSQDQTNQNQNNQDKTNQEQVNQVSQNEDQNTELNIGGAIEEIENSEKTQEEKDVEEIKNKIQFETPINGRISSTFGWRSPTTVTVPKYHTGLDIAANTGTVIKSATKGKVILASSKGDYGNHYKIQTEDIIIIYAHCSKLYLKEGDEVTKGQEIAEVGSTGNSTGPHLHFEIRREGRLVDPQLILNI